MFVAIVATFYLREHVALFLCLALTQADPGAVAEKHDVSQAEAEQTFFNEPLLILEDISHRSYEPRWHALGHSDVGRLLHISFTLRRDGTLMRIISARAMHHKERLRYEKEA
jgi:uncharacterized DUF497 family protein